MNLSAFSFQALPLVSSSELQCFILSEMFMLSNEVTFQYSCTKLIRYLFNSCYKAFSLGLCCNCIIWNVLVVFLLKGLQENCTSAVNIYLASAIQHTKINTLCCFPVDVPKDCSVLLHFCVIILEDQIHLLAR